MADRTFKSFHGSKSHAMDMAEVAQGGQAQPIHDKAELQTYRFEFGGEEQIYSVSFNGKIPDTEIRKILEVMHSRSYADCSGAVWTYLEQNRLEYSDFKTELSPSVHWEIMARADILLKSFSRDAVDRLIGRADNYYAVMDYQKKLRKDCYEGCCYAIKRTAGSGIYNCSIVGQTFTCDQCGSTLNGYFAILSGDGGQELKKIDEAFSEPVLPVFGCVDMLGILININSIHTAKEAEEIAVK